MTQPASEGQEFSGSLGNKIVRDIDSDGQSDEGFEDPWLSLPPALPWVGDILPAVPRVPCHPRSPPKSRSLELAAPGYHTTWSGCGG